MHLCLSVSVLFRYGWEKGKRVKIARVYEITVSGNAKIHRTLGNIALGGKVSAEILERLEGNKAILRVSGEKITAQFMKEIPRGKYLELVLTSRQKNTFVFALSTRKSDVSAAGQYRQFIIMDEGKARANLYRTRALLAEGHSLYDINRVLSGISGQSAVGAFAGFLNVLLKKGMAKKDTEKIAAVLCRLKGGVSRLFRSIITAIAADSDVLEGRATGMFDEGSAREVAGSLGDILESLVWDDELREHFGKLMIWLFKTGGEKESEQEIPLYDDEKYICARMITEGDSMACTFELSELGRLEVFARILGEAILLSIVCESDKSVEILTHDLYHLQKKLHSLMKNGAMVAVYRNTDARDLVDGEIDALLSESRVDVHA